MPMFQCISTTLTNIQKQLNTLEERHKQTDVAISELQNSLKEIKLDSSKQRSLSKKSPPGLSVRLSA